MHESRETNGQEVAVIGLCGRFPGAADINEYWTNLAQGVESISFATDAELLALGVDRPLLSKDNYIKAKGGLLSQWDHFDAAFFGYTPAEAELMDPQTRIVLECAWNAMENAGYNVDTLQGNVGVYAGAGSHHNWEILSFLSNKSRSAGLLATTCLVDKDYLSSRVSHQLNLKGPSYTLHASCATSLVTVHVACQALIDGECDMALAGGVNVYSQDRLGYLDQNDSYFSSDGHCRAFDANASGTVGGEGVGMVVLKLLEDALRDRDYVYAVIKGSAVNNDGIHKANYIAPSVDGQRRVISQAMAFAQVPAQSIGYVECHGTGTLLGDPIELEALKQAFDQVPTASCAIGSVKPNIGHLNGAAGIASLIKTVLAVEHRMLPPSINYSQPNPGIDFANSPFYVNTRLTPWINERYPLRAGVSSFGIGGTNAHVIIEQAPDPKKNPAASRRHQLLTLSAKNPRSLAACINATREALASSHGDDLENIAFTLNHGRKAFNHRVWASGRHTDEMRHKLETVSNQGFRALRDEEIGRPVIFLFSGQGSEYIHMGQGLYQSEPVFEEHLDRCFAILAQQMGEDIRAFLYPLRATDASAANINQPLYAGPIKFSFEYALAQMLMSWGITPKAMLGHSLGEYVCACLAGVMTLEAALGLVVLRNRLMNETAEGAMLGIPLAEEQIVAMLDDRLSLAAVNTPNHCVISGEPGAIDRLADRLRASGIETVRFKVARAGHSQLMAPILTQFERAAAEIDFKPPQIPYISGISGTWITDREATDPNYYAQHIRKTIRFSRALKTLLGMDYAAFIQVGADKGPVAFVEAQPGFTTQHMALNLVRHRKNDTPDERYLIDALGRLWHGGIRLDWAAYYANAQCRRLPLPSYPFDGKKFTLPKADLEMDRNDINLTTLGREHQQGNALYVPLWRQHERPPKSVALPKTARVMMWMDANGYAEQLAQRMSADGHSVIKVYAGQTYHREREDIYRLNIDQKDHYVKLIEDIMAGHRTIDRIVHVMSLGAEGDQPLLARLDHMQTHGFYSLIYLVQALAYCDVTQPVSLDVITNNMHEVIGGELTCPEKATLIGALNVIEAEYHHLTCRSMDVDLKQIPELLESLYQEILTAPDDRMIALRGRFRWIRRFELANVAGAEDTKGMSDPLTPGGVYVIIGGLGRAGMDLSRYLAQTEQVKIILLQRTAVPPKYEWADYLNACTPTDHLAAKIQHLIALEKQGADVLTLSVDVSHTEQMQTAWNRILSKYGRINGIFHCAMEPGGALIQNREKSSMQAVFASKVKGTLILDHLLEGQPLDFMVLFSSISAVLPAAGKVAYCAANAFLDAFAHHKISAGGAVKTMAINWNHWEGTPIAVARETADFIHQNSVTRQEGIAIVQRLLQIPRSQILVSRIDPETLARQVRDNSLEHYASTTITVENMHDTLAEHRQEVDFIAPRTPVEEKIASIWERFFGYPGIGVQDDFFQLGGDSLKALHIIPLMNAQLGCAISIANFYRYPTVEKMAAYIGSGTHHHYEVLSRLSKAGGRRAPSLICFPYAAGGSSTFMGFARAMEHINPDVDIHAVTYPGNDANDPTDMQKDMDGLLAQCAAAVMENSNPPIAIYGHCVGSYLALDLCARLEREDIKVEFVALGGILNAQIMDADDILALDESHMKEIYFKLGTFKGHDRSIPQEEYDRISRNFKQDAMLITQHKNRIIASHTGHRIFAPIFNIISSDDDTTPQYHQKYKLWREYSDTVRLIEIGGGGHYFVNEKATETAMVLNRLFKATSLK